MQYKKLKELFMESIIYKGFSFPTGPMDRSVGSLGREFRLTGIKKNEIMPSRWIDRVEKFHWFYEYGYCDNINEGFVLELDYFDNVKVLLKNK